MIRFPDIKPYIIKLGPLQIRWYGLMYLVGFMSSYLLVRYQIKEKGLKIDRKVVDDIYFYLVLGLILGARIGYVLFYNLKGYINNPLEIFAIWHGGMSFHGGLIGAIVAGVVVALRSGVDFWLFADMITITAPIGLGLGRIGNFINAELYGRVTNVPWAMVFPGSDGLPRHPSQLYEAFFEGVVLFLILWFLRNRIRLKGGLTALFLVLYGLIRFSLEFFRQPDQQLGFVVSFMTMGQVLSSLMVFAGVALYAYLKKRESFHPC
ncbi:prolipoprotein diacylglyceryl transferase [bacterium BMS3Bbin06]|nr:prolipoprotein diacylglyceryl transferase [bacterium BMS3Abin08]GBE35196.1 prolipoprotein diacylglyceryl transferase [bacterium BMS3Bbin06]HDY70213.1 prolipoprotein diacylglyceryl transferase [Nitrospirota bacterium]